MSVSQHNQPGARVQQARGSDPQPGQPDEPSSSDPRRGQPGQPGQRDARVHGPSSSDRYPGQPGDPIRGFFDVFARSSDPLDLDALAGCFDETFLSSDAAGTRVVPRPPFLQALAGRAQTFADAGIGPAALRQLAYQELDPHHVLARTTWAAPRMDGSGEVTLASSFLLRRDGDRLRIVVYVNHQGLPS